MDEDISTEQKTWQVYNLGKINVFRLDLNESREGFCRRGRGKSFHVDGLKTGKAREPTMESGVRNLEAESIRNGVESTGGCVKLKTVTEIRWSRECLSCTELFVGLEASGEIETEVLCGQF